MGKMEYATDILQSLLHKLINKSVGSKHPQLMLRRTETVVEKMLSNWMALCMYNYLKDHVGPSLFLLFKAIKYQIEKGPVDSLTHDARYSLSEERLLREPIDFSVVVSCFYFLLEIFILIKVILLTENILFIIRLFIWCKKIRIMKKFRINHIRYVYY
jgi:hypothetical protein